MAWAIQREPAIMSLCLCALVDSASQDNRGMAAGRIGAETALTLEESARRVQAMHDAAKRVRSDVLVLCHGGPIALPADAQYILDHTEGIVGFYGASSMERLPVEPAIENRVREFCEMKV